MIAFPAVSIPTGFRPITPAQAQKSDPQNTFQHFGMLQNTQNHKHSFICVREMENLTCALKSSRAGFIQPLREAGIIPARDPKQCVRVRITYDNVEDDGNEEEEDHVAEGW